MMSHNGNDQNDRRTLDLTATVAPSARAVQAVMLPAGAVTVIAFVRARAGKESEFVRATEALVPKVRGEPGNLLCHFHQGLDDLGDFAFYEIFESVEALEFHKVTAHVRQWAADVQSLTAGPVELKLLQAIG